MSPLPSAYTTEQLIRAEQWLPAVIAQVPEVTSADKAYTWMRENDLYVPRSYVRTKYAEIIRGAEHIDIINRLPENNLVPRRWMEETSFEYKQKYNYIMKLSGVDAFTTEPREEFTNVASDEELSIGQAKLTALETAFEYGFNVLSAPFDISFDVIKRKG